MQSIYEVSTLLRTKEAILDILTPDPVILNPDTGHVHRMR